MIQHEAAQVAVCIHLEMRENPLQEGEGKPLLENQGRVMETMSEFDKASKAQDKGV